MSDQLLRDAVSRATGAVSFRVPVEDIIRRGHRRRQARRLGGVGGTVVAVLALAFTVQTALRPAPALAGGFVFDDGTTIDILDHVGDEHTISELRARLDADGIDLDTTYRPVQPESDGLVFAVTYPPDGEVDRHGRLLVTPGLAGTTVTIEIGRADLTANAGAGLSIFESIPELCGAVHPEDPRRTATELDKLGFRVQWMLIDFTPGSPSETTHAAEVDEPPAGSAIISVLDRHGASHDVSPTERALLIELVDVREGGHEPLDSCSD